MKYYVVADIHGFFDELIIALDEKGFFTDAEPHKLIVCGDLFDRGTQALKLQKFILDLLAKDSVILIKGNHEDLTLELLNGWPKHSYLQYYHHTNGTIDTVLQLTKMTQDNLNRNPESVGRELLQNPYIQAVIPAMLDYFETSHYIFVHGWIPCTAISLAPHQTQYVYIDGWRNAHEKAWNKDCACSGEIPMGVYFMPSSSTAILFALPLPPKVDCQLSRTRCGSLMVPGCSSTPPGAAPLAKNFAPYSSQAIAMPMAFFAIAMGL